MLLRLQLPFSPLRAHERKQLGNLVKRRTKQEQWNAAWERAAERFLPSCLGSGRRARREGQPETNPGRRGVAKQEALGQFPAAAAHCGQRAPVPGLRRARPALAEQEVLVNRHLVPESTTARGPAGHLRADIRRPLPWTGARLLALPLSAHVNGGRGAFGSRCRGGSLTCPGSESGPGWRRPPSLSHFRSQGSVSSSAEPVLGWMAPCSPHPQALGGRTGRQAEEPPVHTLSHGPDTVGPPTSLGDGAGGAAQPGSRGWLSGRLLCQRPSLLSDCPGILSAPCASDTQRIGSF